ncbi:amidohydrolase family protein [Streptomyces radicis]|uniref:Hydrolase n=1 Tax=Streptomyces radicis TaxID=1750517 RepID=A0A3A9WPR0_9ACTN|nr:amidohydrolase family protein [Streptomyces radicis]RKN08157.1 hydrolase [Streptomyces radicis]RKN20512.1 hydrolase [Streptomyces radicis]
MPERLVLSGPRLADGRTVDVRLYGGRIEAVGTPGSLAPRGAAPAEGTRVDLAGHLLLPAPAEPHAHHDTALTGIAADPPPDTPDELRRRITEAALIQLGHGATAQRSHIRIGDTRGLADLEGALATRRALRGLAELTTVAMPRLLTGRAGADNRALLRDALKMGAGALGGCPDLDPDPAGYLEILLSLADEHGCPIDLHTEADDPARVARLASAVAACRSGVAVGPCTGLSRLPAPLAARCAERLAAAGVTVICLPQGGCGLAHRARGTTPVRLLSAAGVAVAAGGGALRDAANPVGRGDPLEAAFLLASRGACEAPEAYDAISGRARRALGLPEVRIEAGFPAELLALRGETVAGVLSQAYSRLVIHRGRIVARTSAVREYCGSPADGGLELPRQATG